MIEFVLEVERYNRKQKRKLARLLKGLQEAMTALPEAAVLLDKRHRAEWWNAEAVRLLGLRAARDTGRPVGEILSGAEWQEYLDAGDFETPVEIVSPVDPNLRLAARMVPYGRGKRVLLQVRDVTRVSQLEQIRRDFVANTSHELRNPLTVILGYLETMQDAEVGQGTWSRPISQMYQQAVRIRGIVEDMLTLSTMESGDRALERQFIDLSQLLDSVKEEGEILSGERRHRILLDCQPGFSLYANPEEVHSAFSNLVSNAVRYSPNGGEIRLRWWIDGQGAYFAVSDNGIGVDAKHIPRLTERFYRVDKARSRETGGTGLGLAIVKHVLGRLGGYLEIESEPGVGSTFTCHLPLRLLVKSAA